MKVPVAVPIDALTLTNGLKASVPSLEGLTDRGRFVEVRALTGVFTPSEEATIRAFVAQHNGDLARQAKQQRQALVRAERAKDPAGLTLEQRVARLESLLDAA